MGLTVSQTLMLAHRDNLKQRAGAVFYRTSEGADKGLDLLRQKSDAENGTKPLKIG